jgi:hypothetical protein
MNVCITVYISVKKFRNVNTSANIFTNIPFIFVYLFMYSLQKCENLILQKYKENCLSSLNGNTLNLTYSNKDCYFFLSSKE